MWKRLFANGRFNRSYPKYTYSEYKPKPTKRYYHAGGLILVLGGYYWWHLEKVPYSNRYQFIDLSERHQKLLEKASFQQLYDDLYHHILPSKHPLTGVVAKVAAKIVQVAGLDNITWRVFVVDAPEVKNAFVLPGGQIFVFSGLLSIVPDEDSLAAILGHEIAHVVARHSMEKLSYFKIILYLQLVLATIFDPSLIANRTLLDFAFWRPFSRKMESEADYIGLMLMSKACFNPKKAITMFQRITEDEGHIPEKILDYTSTHPSFGTRIKRMREWMPEALQVREQSNCMSVLSHMHRFNMRY